MEFDENETSEIGTIVAIFGPFIAALLLVLWIVQNQVSIINAVLLVLWTFAGMMFVTLGLHRMMTHESFRAVHWLKMVLIIGAITVLQGHIRNWVLFHRRHHKYADTIISEDKKTGDMSSPVNMYVRFGKKIFGILIAFLYSHFLWMLDKTIPLQPREFGKNRKESTYAHIDDDVDVKWVDSHFAQIVVCSFAWTIVVGLLEGIFTHQGISGCLWEALKAFIIIGVFRNFLVSQWTFSINSWTHMKGKQDFYVGEDDQSRNPFSLLTPNTSVSLDELKLALVKLKIVTFRELQPTSDARYRLKPTLYSVPKFTDSQLQNILDSEDQPRGILRSLWNVATWLFALFCEIMTGGEWIHNTHHKFQSSPNFALEDGQIDIGFKTLQGCEKAGWVIIYHQDIPSREAVLKARKFKKAIDQARELKVA